jgi:hypothetical protein
MILFQSYQGHYTIFNFISQIYITNIQQSRPGTKVPLLKALGPPPILKYHYESTGTATAW